MHHIISSLEAQLRTTLPKSPLRDLIDLSRTLPVSPLNHAHFQQYDVSVLLLRCDDLHPVISGNKWFKLKYNLLQALLDGHDTLVSFGGAWSNHLHALACVAHYLGLDCIGVVRGDELHVNSNDMLQDVTRLGMALEFVSRGQYREWCRQPQGVVDFLGRSAYVIPEGGDNGLGVMGAASMLSSVPFSEISLTHLVCAVGTGCMFSGLRLAAPSSIQCIGVSALKGGWVTAAMEDRFAAWQQWETQQQQGDIVLFPRNSWQIETEYHRGGFGRVDENVLGFIRQFRDNTHIEMEPVYTGKTMMALFDLVERGVIPRGSRVLFVHSGGLQGNRGFC